ncbi:MAG: sulfotransferase domain-containing protein [Thiobacillaceae bacterium]
MFDFPISGFLQDDKDLAFQSPVWWANLGRMSMLLAKAVHPSGKPLVVFSLPRSGSSWIGELLGSASNALYLREPLSRSHLVWGGNATVFDIDPASPPDVYALFAARAFNGLPVFPRGVIRYLEQWSLQTRTQRRLVLKIVSPLALPWLLEAYHPRVIFLVRHPAAVACSYWELGWRNREERLSQIGPRLMSGPLRPWQDTMSAASGFWHAHGVFQGAVLRVVMDSLAYYTDYKVVTYEESCLDPNGTFRDLFHFAELDFDEETEKRIAESSSSPSQGAEDPYSTRKDSRAMQYAWKRRIDVEQLAQLHSGFSPFKLPFYDSADDWTI